MCRLLNNKVVFHFTVVVSRIILLLVVALGASSSTSPCDMDLAVALQVAPTNALPQQLKTQFEWENHAGRICGESGCQLFRVLGYPPAVFENNLLLPLNEMNKFDDFTHPLFLVLIKENNSGDSV